MPRIRFTKAHNGYQPGDELDVDNGVADAIVTWAKAAEYVADPPVAAAPAPIEDAKHDKMMRSKGGKQLVRTK